MLSKSFKLSLSRSPFLRNDNEASGSQSCFNLQTARIRGWFFEGLFKMEAYSFFLNDHDFDQENCCLDYPGASNPPQEYSVSSSTTSNGNGHNELTPYSGDPSCIDSLNGVPPERYFITGTFQITMWFNSVSISQKIYRNRRQATNDFNNRRPTPYINDERAK